MARYGMDYGPRGMGRGGRRYGSEYGGYGMETGGGRGGMNRERAFRGRGGAYDTYFRRDFLTNQGDFTREFGGGEGYGYRGMNEPRGAMGGRFGGVNRGYGRDFERGYRGRGGEVFGGSRGEEDRISYGPHFGERWASIQPEDLARRNFEGRYESG